MLHDSSDTDIPEEYSPDHYALNDRIGSTTAIGTRRE